MAATRKRKPPSAPPANPSPEYLVRRRANTESARKHRANKQKALEEGKEYKDKYEKLFAELEVTKKQLKKMETKYRRLVNRIRMSAIFNQRQISTLIGQDPTVGSAKCQSSDDSTDSDSFDEFFVPNIPPEAEQQNYDSSEYFTTGPPLEEISAHVHNGFQHLQTQHPLNNYGITASWMAPVPPIEETNTFAMSYSMQVTHQPTLQTHLINGTTESRMSNTLIHEDAVVLSTDDNISNQNQINSSLNESSMANLAAQPNISALPTIDTVLKGDRPDDFMISKFTRRPRATGESSQNQQQRKWATFEEFLATKTGFTPVPDATNPNPTLADLVDDCLSPALKKCNLGTSQK